MRSSRFVCIAALLAAAAHAQIARLAITLQGATPTQAVFSYDTPDGSACSLKAVEDAHPEQAIHDVDSKLFAGADQDLSRPSTAVIGTHRTITIGARTSDVAGDRRLYSRALQAATRHVLSVACGRATGDLIFDTQNPPLGNTYPETPPVNAAGFGNYAWPTVDWLNPMKTYIDPMTGILLKPAHAISPKGRSGEWGNEAQEWPFTDVFDLNKAWANAASILAGSKSGPFASYSGAASDPVFLPFPRYGIADWVTPSGWSLDAKLWDDVRVTVYGFASDSDPENRKVLMCLGVFFIPGKNACAGPEMELTLPAGSAAAVATPDFPKPGFGAWNPGRFLNKDEAGIPTGNVMVNNSVVTWKDGYYFPLSMPAGVKIKIGTAWYTVATVESATTLTLAEPAVRFTAPVQYQIGGFGVRLRKKTAFGSVNISATWASAWTRASEMPLTGEVDLCSRLSVTVNYEADGVTPMNPARQGRICFMGRQNPMLILLIPETGETRVLSGLDHLDAGSQTSASIPFGAFSPTDPLTIYGYHGDDAVPSLPLTIRSLYQITYDPSVCHFRAWPGTNYLFRNDRNNIPTDCVTWYNLTRNAEGRGVVTQFQNAVSQNPFWDPAVMSNGSVGFGGISGNYAFLYQYFAGPQDSPCFMAIFDLTTGNLVKATDSFGGTTPTMRWGGCHTTPSLSVDQWFAPSLVLLMARHDRGYLGGPFQIQSVDAVSKDAGATWSNDTSLTSLDASACTTTDPDMMAKGAAGNRCVKLRISSDYPCNLLPTNGDAAKYPCPWNPNLAGPMALQPGDYLADMQADSPESSYATNGKAEKMLITSKTSIGGGKWELEVMRWAACDDQIWYSHITSPGGSLHLNGWRAFMTGTGMCSGTMAWMDATDPSPTFYTDSSGVTAGHVAMGPGPDGTYATVVDGGASRIGPMPAQINQPVNFVQNLYTSTFAGVTRISGSEVESYPTLGQWTAPGTNKLFAFDLRHLNPDWGSGAEVPVTIWPQKYSLVPGAKQVYKIDNYGGVFGKVIPYLAFAGRYLLQDVSGPSAIIADTDQWKFCVAYKAGECRPESSVNDAYVNVPRASVANGCVVNSYALNSPCFTTPFAYGAWVTQYPFTQDDPNGTHYRRLTMGFTGPGRQYQFSSFHATPEGQWGFVAPGWIDGVRPEAMMVKIPPAPPVDDGIDRSSFIPYMVTVPPDAASVTARARFGYAENGPVNSYFCTSRREACVTDDQTAPFAYEQSDTLTAAACGLAGCTLTIPVIPGRVVFYRVERMDSLGKVVSIGPMQVYAAP